MNTSEITLNLTVEEHEVLLDAINNYYSIILENLPVEILPDGDHKIRYESIKTAQQKIVNNWSARFDK